MNLALLRALADMDDDTPEKKISKEGQIARIREVGDRYRSGNPFKVGDWITPREGCNIKGAGDPHLVIAIEKEPQPQWIEASGSYQNGAMFDVRILCMMSDNVVPFWQESQNFETYTGPGLT